MAESGEDKTEQPTQKKLKDSRKEGTNARTPELGAWAVMLLLSMWLKKLIGMESTKVQEVMQTSFAAAGNPQVSTAMNQMSAGLTHAFTACIIFGAAIAVISSLFAGAQGGVHMATKAAKPKFSRMNPIKGFKRVFGPHSLWEGAKLLVKTTVVGLVVWSAVKGMMPMVGGMVPEDILLRYAADSVVTLVRNAAIAGIVMGAADYVVMKRRVGKQVRMTKTEVKQENKSSEGDPLLKSAIRSRQMAMARGRMMSDVATADVLLVNPTHVAIALKYDPDKGAPRVVARGAGAIAARIRQQAADNDVPLVRDIALTRALYKSCQVGQHIPLELFNAVAHVLAFVMSTKKHTSFVDVYDSPRPAGEELPFVPRVRRRR
jgi:flagellar biosynthetic protein FlhB